MVDIRWSFRNLERSLLEYSPRHLCVKSIYFAYSITINLVMEMPQAILKIPESTPKQSFFSYVALMVIAI